MDIRRSSNVDIPLLSAQETWGEGHEKRHQRAWWCTLDHVRRHSNWAATRVGVRSIANGITRVRFVLKSFKVWQPASTAKTVQNSSNKTPMEVSIIWKCLGVNTRVKEIDGMERKWRSPNRLDELLVLAWRRREGGKSRWMTFSLSA